VLRKKQPDEMEQESWSASSSSEEEETRRVVQPSRVPNATRTRCSSRIINKNKNIGGQKKPKANVRAQAHYYAGAHDDDKLSKEVRVMLSRLTDKEIDYYASRNK